ncbi:hypothetical protein [Halorussus amylolyticus]|uniref:hypothetical protein n=1 Tax=Halorussus amylolyticus TaxID=1126242 RepID=UPI0010460E31|nr:hypothetical protein [Halorussus amylolyticus]
MYPPCGNRVLKFVRDRVGESLYAVSVYDMDDFSVLYQRPEIERVFSTGEVEEYFDLLRTVHRSLYEVEHLNSKVGEPRANLTYYEGMHVLLLPVDEVNGVAVAISSESGTQFSAFADECLQRARAPVN